MNKLLSLLKSLVEVDQNVDQVDQTNLATAAACLLIEVARSDTDKAETEISWIKTILEREFDVEPAVTETLMNEANAQVEGAHDLYQFTQVINEAYSYQQKEALLEAMWQVAFADGSLDAIEDHMIRRVAGLLHLAHEDFIRLKLKVKNTTG